LVLSPTAKVTVRLSMSERAKSCVGPGVAGVAPTGVGVAVVPAVNGLRSTDRLSCAGRDSVRVKVRVASPLSPSATEGASKPSWFRASSSYTVAVTLPAATCVPPAPVTLWPISTSSANGSFRTLSFTAVTLTVCQSFQFAEVKVSAFLSSPRRVVAGVRLIATLASADGTKLSRAS